MLSTKSNKKIISLIMCVLLIISAVSVTVSADDTEITEGRTYVLNRDSNGDHLFQYQSPCMIGYDIDNKYGGSGVPIQAFVFTMYDSISGNYIPTYCTDINVTAVQGANYRRLNLEDSPFAGSTAGKIRAILQEGFYIIPIDGESDDAHTERVNAAAAQLGKAAGVENLTVGEAIAATQCAIWQSAHGSILSFPKFCRYVFNPNNTKYVSLCSYSELNSKANASINSTIESVYNYLLSLEPVEATEKTVSPASFEKLNKPTLTQNHDGTYNISVTTTVDVDIIEGDSLTLKAQINKNYTAVAKLSDGEQTVTLTLRNVPAAIAFDDVKLSISGYQTASGFFYFDANGDRSASQAMVGYSNGRLPVYAEVVATDNRVLNIYKSTNLESGNEPIGDIIFDIYLVATKEQYDSGNVTLPDAKEYAHPKLAEYTLITDENGKASLNFLHYGLPDGVYLIVERNHPNVVKPIDPFYLYLPSSDPITNDPVYEITINPKNELKSNIRIEKDVISIGNDAASVNAYEAHTWIIGTTIPADISSGKTFIITDNLDSSLDYIGNLKVKLEKNNDTTASVELIADTDYNLILTDVDSLSENKPSDSIKIELTAEGMSKISTAIGSNNFSDYMLRIYFDAQINANATAGVQIPNQAEVKYVNASNIELNKKSDKPYVLTGGINLLKVDAADNSKTLSDAVFEVYRAATAEEVAAKDNRLTEIPAVDGKVIKVSFFNNASLEGDKVTSVSSDKNGNVAIYGLAYGKYYLIEVKAPKGYNTLNEALELKIGNSSHTDDEILLIENVSGTVLPATGGVGTTIFTTLGISLIFIACVMFIYKRRTTIQ